MNGSRDEYTLWQQLKEKGCKEAREKLIIKYLSLVKYQAGRIKMLVPTFIEQGDLESYGVIGLIDAIERFDPEKGIKFKTYASKRIRGEIIDYLRRLDWLPHNLRQDGKRIKAEAERLTKKLGKSPSIEELASNLNISRKKINSLYYKIYSSQMVSLYNQVGDNPLLNLLQEEEGKQPESIFQEKEKEKILSKALEQLNEKEYLVISLYYYEELTQVEIAEVMNLSPARISQIHKKAVYRLRGLLSRKKEQLV